MSTRTTHFLSCSRYRRASILLVSSFSASSISLSISHRFPVATPSLSVVLFLLMLVSSVLPRPSYITSSLCATLFCPRSGPCIGPIYVSCPSLFSRFPLPLSLSLPISLCFSHMFLPQSHGWKNSCKSLLDRLALVSVSSPEQPCFRYKHAFLSMTTS